MQDRARVNQSITHSEIDKIGDTEWLDDNVINAATTLLRQLATEMGLEIDAIYNVEFGAGDTNYPPALGSKWQLYIIIHNGVNRWMLVANGFEADKNRSNNSFVFIYDSLNTRKMNRHVVATCCFIVHIRGWIYHRNSRK